MHYLRLGVGLGLYFLFGILGCVQKDFIRESPLPGSLANQTSQSVDALDLADFLAYWHAKDWRAQFAKALTCSKPEDRKKYLILAIELKPDEPMLLYALALEWMEDSSGEAGSAAEVLLLESIRLEPENGVLQLTLAVVQSRLGKYAQARMLFQFQRGFPDGDLYSLRLEKTILGLLQSSSRLNPYDLIQAQTWFQSFPFPPILDWAQALERVFLDPLDVHPYDIRFRGWEAAQGLGRLGRKLSAASLKADRIFSDGREERWIGALLQVEAKEFTECFLKSINKASLVPNSLRSAGKVIFLTPKKVPFEPHSDWDGILITWENTLNSTAISSVPSLSMVQALEKMRTHSLWRKVLRVRIPRQNS